MSGFEKFPREIRDMIYGLCLCVDGILIPYPESLDTEEERTAKGHKPVVALLTLNKQIRDEALPILFGKNTWSIPAKEVDLAEDDASSLDNEKVDTLWYRYGSHIQKVDLKYARTQHPPESFKDIMYYAHELSPGDTLEDRSVRADTIHDHVRIDLKSGWVVIADALECCPNIESLHIDTEDLYCPFGCCRTNIVRSLFTKPGYMAVVKAEVKVSVSGILDEEERGYVIAWRTRCGSGQEKKRNEAIARTQIIMCGSSN